MHVCVRVDACVCVYVHMHVFFVYVHTCKCQEKVSEHNFKVLRKRLCGISSRHCVQVRQSQWCHGSHRVDLLHLLSGLNFTLVKLGYIFTDSASLYMLLLYVLRLVGLTHMQLIET